MRGSLHEKSKYNHTRHEHDAKMWVSSWLDSKKFGHVFLDEDRGCVCGHRYTKLKMVILLHDYPEGCGMERLRWEFDRYLNFLGYTKKDQVCFSTKSIVNTF